MKYAFPDHAQRMSTLFASDKLLADCRSREEGMGSTPHVHECVGWEARKGRGGRWRMQCAGEGSTGDRGARHGRSVP